MCDYSNCFGNSKNMCWCRHRKSQEAFTPNVNSGFFMEAVDSHPPIQTYIPLLWYSHNHPSLVILLGGLTRLSRLCSWLKFVTMKNTEQKQQEKDMHQGIYRGPAQVSSRVTQDVLSLWQQTTGTRVDYLCSGKPIRGSGSVFHGGWFCRPIILAASHDS